MIDPMKISNIQSPKINPTQMRPAQPTTVSNEISGKSFRDVLAETVSEVQHLQNEADTTIKKLVAGEIKDVTEAMVAVEQADMAFQTMMTVRNKVLNAYQEIMRMQV